MRQSALPLLLLGLAFANTFHADADSPDAKVKEAEGANTFQARADALNAKIEKAAGRYTRGKYDGVVRLLEGLDKEIDALSAQYPNEKSKWMPGVKKSGVYCLLAATYRVQNEPEKSAKYEALFKKPFKAIGQDVNVDEFLRLVLQDSEVQFDLEEVEVEPGEVELKAVGPSDKDE